MMHGWSNWQTYTAFNWVTSDESDFNYWSEQAREFYSDAPGAERLTQDEIENVLAAQLQYELTRNATKGLHGFYADLLDDALDKIDYRELARHFLYVTNRTDGDDGRSSG